MVNTETRRPFGDADQLLAEALARKAATAVENARLYVERGKIAATLQEGLLPPTLPEVPGFALASVYRAAGDANEVGGDFYDVAPLSEGGWLAVIGDVAGKGAEAAALTARARHTIVSITSVTCDPAEAFARLDDSLRTQTDRGLVSASVLILGDDRVQVARAGHPPPLLVRGGVPEPIGEAGPLLGLGAPPTAWEVVELELLPEDALVLYTDGVLDAVGAEERFGERRLMAALAGDVGSQGPEAMAACIERALEDFQEGPQRDDVAILIVQRLPVGGAARTRRTPASTTG
jgi:serine phosphatase RsbU (regulator of sigma subunit)